MGYCCILQRKIMFELYLIDIIEVGIVDIFYIV